MFNPFEDCPLSSGAGGGERGGGADPVVRVDRQGRTQVFFPDWGCVDWARAMVAALGLVGRISVHHLSAMRAMEEAEAVEDGQAGRPGSGSASPGESGRSRPRAA